MRSFELLFWIWGSTHSARGPFLRRRIDNLPPALLPPAFAPAPCSALFNSKPQSQINLVEIYIGFYLVLNGENNEKWNWNCVQMWTEEYRIKLGTDNKDMDNIWNMMTETLTHAPTLITDWKTSESSIHLRGCGSWSEVVASMHVLIHRT